ncbi:acetyltransferase [Adhaeribacter sp. BT258]|uniref:Acetyltransferase n=1 Tax=Adhaeribacter terrigena TaxID=2793070 RepID=A0ABS1BX37_9BACT|nr:acetyltransferase [Adhaeribacter terrigena]MBK0401704.1 acetyltransferase [Adhaeribacter terrigena]
MKAKEPILLIGGGGNCKSVIEAIESEGKYQVAGIVDAPDRVGKLVLGYPIIGSDEDLPEFLKQVPNALITVGQLKSAASRIRIFDAIKAAGARLPVIVASTANVSKHALIGEGTVILHGALVNADAVVGVNNIINTGAIIEHDAVTGNHCHISTGAVLNGDCVVGNEVLIGSNAVLKQGIKIADKAVVGAGSIVLKDVDAGMVVVGNPAKIK